MYSKCLPTPNRRPFRRETFDSNSHEHESLSDFEAGSDNSAPEGCQIGNSLVLLFIFDLYNWKQMELESDTPAWELPC
jgi:hypothetical protein